jgi:hypothetical protein
MSRLRKQDRFGLLVEERLTLFQEPAGLGGAEEQEWENGANFSQI